MTEAAKDHASFVCGNVGVRDCMFVATLPPNSYVENPNPQKCDLVEVHLEAFGEVQSGHMGGPS